MKLEDARVCGHCLQVLHKKNIWKHIRGRHDPSDDMQTMIKWTTIVCYGTEKEDVEIEVKGFKFEAK